MKFLKLFEELSAETMVRTYQDLKKKGYYIRAENILNTALDSFFEKLLDGLEVYKIKSKPKSKFFIKHERGSRVVYMEQNARSMRLFCSHEKIWSYLSNDLNLSQYDIQRVIIERMRNKFNFKIYTPVVQRLVDPPYWREISNMDKTFEELSGTELIGPVGPAYGDIRPNNNTINQGDTGVIRSNIDGRIYTIDEYKLLYNDYLKSGGKPLNNAENKENIDIVLDFLNNQNNINEELSTETLYMTRQRKHRSL